MTDSSDSHSVSARVAFLRGLRAVRQLLPDPLPEAVLHDILEVARWSGSAGNRQPWEFVVVRERDMLRRLSAIDGANAGHLAISLGYPAEHLQRTPNPPGRKPLEQLVHWGHY
jgi:nitroreductase